MNLSKSSTNSFGLPLVGFGTYQLSDDQAEFAVSEAIKAGFRHIDSAEAYQNELGTGRALQKSSVNREELFITTKVFPGYKTWNTPEKNFDQVIETLKRQLTELQLEYIDLYLIHAPLSELRLEQWNALIELKKLGLAKHIGVSNYNQETINEIIDAGLEKPEANQVEFHPICAQKELTQFMKTQSIEPIAYSSLAPLSTWRTAEGQGGEVLAEVKTEGQQVIKEIAEELNVSEAKLLLRWGLQHGYAVLTKSSKPERIKQNLELFDFEISQEQMNRLNELDKNQPIAWAASGINPMGSAPSISE